MTGVLKERLATFTSHLCTPPVSSEGEGSPIIWPRSKKKNDSTKITYNDNL